MCGFNFDPSFRNKFISLSLLTYPYFKRCESINSVVPRTKIAYTSINKTATAKMEIQRVQ